MKSVRFAVLAAAITLVGCGLNQDQEFREAVPTVEGLTLELTGTASEASTQARLVDGLASSGAALTTPSEYLAHARDGVRMVNVAVRELVATARSIVEEHEGQQVRPGVRMYGPKDVGNVTYRLLVKRLTENAYGWRVDAKPLGAEDTAYVRVMAGAVQRAAEGGGKRGAFGLNLNRLKEVDASTPGQGVLLAGYATRDGNKTLAYRLQEFTPDLGAHAAVSAAFVGHRRADTGGTAVRLAVKANLGDVPNGTDAKELVRLRARWVPGVGGRAGALATGGDIPDGEAYVGAACWDAQLEERYKILKHCTGIGTGSRSCTTVHESGAAAECRAEVSEPGEPALDPMDGALEDDAPDGDVTPPSEEPTGDTEG